MSAAPPHSDVVDTILANEPAEAIFLGVADAGRWAALDGASLEAEAAFCDAVVTASDGQGHDERAARRWASWRRHAIRAAGVHALSLDAAVLPFAAWQFELLHGVTSEQRQRMVSRLADLPRYLRQLTTNLRAGQTQGRVVDRGTAQALVDSEWRGCVGLLAEDASLMAALGSPAGAALAEARVAAEDFGRFLADEVLPQAGRTPIAGEAEVDFTLRETMGITQRASEVVALGRRRLNQARADLGVLTGGATNTEVGAAIAAVMASRVATTDAIVPLYRDHVARASHLLGRIAPGLLPRDATTTVALSPAGLPHAANWPAPLTRAGRSATFFVDSRPQHHVIAWSADLAVHEAIPGHALQSLVWQQRFGGGRVPARCLFMADPVAIAHRFWGAMVAIEGWAVYAETWMRREGLFSPDEALCVRVSDAIRYARLVADVSLQTGWMSDEEAVALLVDNACVSHVLARAEVARYHRIPLQASTYALGLEGIIALQSRWDGPGDFHAWLLDHGPVPPAEL